MVIAHRGVEHHGAAHLVALENLHCTPNADAVSIIAIRPMGDARNFRMISRDTFVENAWRRFVQRKEFDIKDNPEGNGLVVWPFYLRPLRAVDRDERIGTIRSGL